MADITIRKGSSEAVRPHLRADWDPFRWTRDLTRWDPFRAMQMWPIEDSAGGFIPAFDVKETKEDYTFKADLPGIKDKDVEVTLTGNRLTVSGKREEEKEEKTDTYYTCERSYGTFTRSFTLPEGVDAERIKAELKEGVLTLHLAKKPEAQAKKITVKS